jgi:uncharacterized membrane protein (UPF0127 family)
MGRMNWKIWMHMGWLWVIVAITGCGRAPGIATATPDDRRGSDDAEQVLHLDHAQPKLRTTKLYLADKTVVAEIAQSLTQIATGMMFRESMGEDDGMLFVFNYPHQTSFYMKNTKVPLSCAYIDREGKILEIYDMEPLSLEPIPSESDQIQFVLEMNQGWFEKNNIKAGTRIVSERGTLLQHFFNR